MEEIKLDVEVRNEFGTRNIKKIRRADFLPGIVYGGKKKETPIKFNKRSYERIMRHHRGESVVFHINVMEGKKKLRDYSAIVKEEQHDPVTDAILHIDFNRISLKEELEVKVPIEVKGEAIGVKRDEGNLDQIMWELDVVCLPTNIPQNLEIDVTEMEIGNSVHVKDIKLPEGVRTNHDPEATVLSISAPRKEEELEAPPAEGEELTEPEVIKEKGKEEKAEEGKEEPKAKEKAEEKKEDNKEEKK